MGGQPDDPDDELLNKTIKGGIVSTMADSVVSLDTADNIGNYFKNIKDMNIGWAVEVSQDTLYPIENYRVSIPSV